MGELPGGVGCCGMTLLNRLRERQKAGVWRAVHEALLGRLRAEAVPRIKGKPGAPLKKPKLVMGDRGYDSDPHRMKLSSKGIKTRIARRRTDHGSVLGVWRYVVEQTIALFHPFRRLLVRHDRDDAVHEAFTSAACSVICWRRLHSAAG